MYLNAVQQPTRNSSTLKALFILRSLEARLIHDISGIPTIVLYTIASYTVELYYSTERGYYYHGMVDLRSYMSCRSTTLYSSRKVTGRFVFNDAPSSPVCSSLATGNGCAELVLHSHIKHARELHVKRYCVLRCASQALGQLPQTRAQQLSEAT